MLDGWKVVGKSPPKTDDQKTIAQYGNFKDELQERLKNLMHK